MTFEQCAVTVGDRRWDFSTTEIADKVFKHSYNGIDYFVKFCKELMEADLPDYVNKTRIGLNAARCNATRKHCIYFSSIYDFEWTPKNDGDLRQGIIFESDGEPNMVAIDIWEDYEMEFEFLCDESSQSWEPEWILDITTQDPRIVLKWANSASCGTPASPTPEPTPEWNPDTDVLFRHDDDEDLAISMDMKDVSNGRFGVHAPVFYNMEADDVRFLFINPSERIMGCPFGAEQCIGDLSNTSVWLCEFDGKTEDPKLKKCVSYGVLNQSMVPDLMNDYDIFDGFYFDFTPSEDGKVVRLTMKCDNVYPANHMIIDPINTKFYGDGQMLHVVAEAKNACPRTVPTPAPLVGECHLKETLGGYTLDLDLTKFTDKTSPLKASVTKEIGGPKMDIIYLPCDGMLCPKGYDCGGDEDAFVWLCEEQKPVPGYVPFCTGYGLHENNLTMGVTRGYIFTGVDVTYKGDNKLSSVAHWKCNESLGQNDVYFEHYVHLDGNIMKFDIASRQACVSGSGPTPTPPARPVPRKPVKGSTPTPTPVPSPNPFDFLFNETHYIFFDMSRFSTPSEKVATNMPMYIRGQRTTIYTEWSAWDQIGCPSGWECGEFTAANLWQCWFDEQWQPYCHPVADKYVPGLHSEIVDGTNLDSGLKVVYEGQLGVNMEIIATCDPFSMAGWSMPIGNAVITYQDSINNGEWSFNVSAGIACPEPWESPVAPTTPREEPPSNASQTFSISETIEGKTVGLNLKKMKYVAEEVFLGYGKKFHKAEVHLSPSTLMGCPHDKNCGVYASEKANAWKCIGTGYHQCFPVGDMRYGLSMSFQNQSHAMSGITVNYDGGAVKHEIHFNFQCNETVPWGEINFDETGAETPGGVSVIFAHTRHVCPNSEGKLTGGAVFLIIVFALVVGYFGVGTLIVYITSGVVAVPFEGFWSEVWQSLTTAIVFIFTCGKGGAAGSVSYDKI